MTFREGREALRPDTQSVLDSNISVQLISAVINLFISCRTVRFFDVMD
jgi:hypothetical protein